MKSVPEVLRIKENVQVLKYLAPLSCHSDIVEPLNEQLKKYSDVQLFCPDGASFKYCLWYVDNTVLAFAVGMQKISLRLPAGRHEDAILDGGAQCVAAGEDWISFAYDTNMLEKWAGVSYEYAKNS